MATENDALFEKLDGSGMPVAPAAADAVNEWTRDRLRGGPEAVPEAVPPRQWPVHTLTDTTYLAPRTPFRFEQPFDVIFQTSPIPSAQALLDESLATMLAGVGIPPELDAPMPADSFHKKRIPALAITPDQLDRQVDTDKPVKVVDKESESPAAISIPFAALPTRPYVRGGFGLEPTEFTPAATFVIPADGADPHHVVQAMPAAE